MTDVLGSQKIIEDYSMNLSHYFTEKKGIGVMATSNAKGEVDTAIYSRPHVQGSDEIAFVMRDHLTHHNLQENRHACYLFIEDGGGYTGVRLFLTQIDESTDDALISAMTRRQLSPEEDRAKGRKFLVRFKVDKVLNLIGGDEIHLD
jgi:hypothetical protein